VCRFQVKLNGRKAGNA
jgi:hypothetical protein